MPTAVQGAAAGINVNVEQRTPAGASCMDAVNSAVRVNVVAGGGAGGTASNFGAAFPAQGTAAGFLDAAGNMEGAEVHDMDLAAGTENNIGVSLREATPGGSVATGVAGNALRIDPTGATAQPVTDNAGSLTVDDGGGSLTVDGTVGVTGAGTSSAFGAAIPAQGTAAGFLDAAGLMREAEVHDLDTGGGTEFNLVQRDGAGYTSCGWSGISQSDGQWHHFVGVLRAADDRELYVDGLQRNTSNVSRAFPNIDLMTLGQIDDTSPDSPFDGWVRGAFVFNRALTPDEIQWLYREGYADIQSLPIRIWANAPTVGVDLPELLPIMGVG